MTFGAAVLLVHTPQEGKRSPEAGESTMWRALKYLFRFAILALLGLTAYAMLADLPPPTKEIVVDLKATGTSQ